MRVRTDIHKWLEMWLHICWHQNSWNKMEIVTDALAGKELRPWQAQLEEALKAAPDGKVLWIHNKGTSEGVSTWLHHWMATHPADVFFDADVKAKDVQNYYAQLHKGKKERPHVVVWEYKAQEKGTKDKACYAGFATIKDGCHYDLRYGQGQIFWAAPHVVVFSREAPDFTKMSLWKTQYMVLQAGSMAAGDAMPLPAA